jgi:hypothetical protein
MPIRWPVTNADQVRGYVALTHAPCPRCRYPLEGLRDPVCPECGTPLTVEALARPRGLAAVREAVFGGESGDGGVGPFRILAGVNILLAMAIMVSAVMHHGELPLLSWLAPAVLGAFACSLQYIAVFARYCPVRSDPVEGWGEGTATMVALIQIAGLIFMWV